MDKFIVFNWKMNPQTEDEALKLARASDQKNVVVCPPFPFLKAVKGVLGKAVLGAQDVFYEEGGAYTGEVSPEMLKSLGVKYVIIGHSERRQAGETDQMINKKMHTVLRDGIIPVLCVGESYENRKAGDTHKILLTQLESDLAGLTKAEPIFVAYEPVWAIGTGDNDTPEDAEGIIGFLRESVHNVYPHDGHRFLYGGSVTSANLSRYTEYPKVDGALVGGASLKVEEIKALIDIIHTF